MTVERGLRIAAGIVVLGSVSLSAVHHPFWLFLTAFAGLNLLQSGFSDWCPMVWFLEKAGLQRCPISVGVDPEKRHMGG